MPLLAKTFFLTVGLGRLRRRHCLSGTVKMLRLKLSTIRQSGLVRLAFALEQTYQARLRPGGQEAQGFSNQDLLEVVDQKDSDELAAPEFVSEDDSQLERNREFVKQATLMVAGSQNAGREIPYLIDRVRETLGKAPQHGTVCFEEDISRIERIEECLILGKKQQTYRCIEGSEGFQTELREHATGFLAPIINELVVFWNAPILENGIVLIDLPGVGIAGDIHAAVTEQYIREKAKV